MKKIEIEKKLQSLHGILVVWMLFRLGHVRSESSCEKARVPCPNRDGFQYFNKSCFAVVRDTPAFTASDGYYKCQEGFHLHFSDPSMQNLDQRMTLARIVSRGVQRVVTQLRKEMVERPDENTLVGMACSNYCDKPSGWIYPASEAHVDPELECHLVPVCNWLETEDSVWAQPPGSDPPPEDGVHSMPKQEDTSPWGSYKPPLRTRLAVMGPRGLVDAPQTLEYNTVACEIPYHITDEEIHELVVKNLASESDLALHSQMVRDLMVDSVPGAPSRVQLTWHSPKCNITDYFVIVSTDGHGRGTRSAVSAETDCHPDTGCSRQVDLPPCSMVDIYVGAILHGEDAAPDVVQWQSPAPADPPVPSKFYFSEIVGSVVTLAWESPVEEGPCQPSHEVTIEGRGTVSAEPGVTRLKVNLESNCELFNASIEALLLGRTSGLLGPIQAATGPPAPGAVSVLQTGTAWTHLSWASVDGPTPPCVLRQYYRTTCWPQPPGRADRPAVLAGSRDREANVTGLAAGTRYKCGVCSLANVADPDVPVSWLAALSCGDLRFVELTTAETAPSSPPLHLNVTEIGHDFLDLSWQIPDEPNGIITTYTIWGRCERRTFPLCASDPLCVYLAADVQTGGQYIEHVTFRLTGLRPARSYQVTVMASTAVGHGPESDPVTAETLSGVPPPPTGVAVTPLVRSAPETADRTSVSVSLVPPCPYPGRHQYRLQLDTADFAGAGTPAPAPELSADQLLRLYSGELNISFSVYDGKWTPGFNYVVRVVAVSENEALGEQRSAASEPVPFTMTVPPPGEVRGLAADCSEPLRLSFRWANPSERPFGIIGYRSRYECRHAPTGQEVAGEWTECLHSECPCVSSETTDQCAACERVCNYPVKRYTFTDQQTYYFNCSCRREVTPPAALVLPSSDCSLAVQAVSKYGGARGALTSVTCQTAPHGPEVRDLQASCGPYNLTGSWAVPQPPELLTKAYHVQVLQNVEYSSYSRMVPVITETLGTSHCTGGRCGAEWPVPAGEVTYLLRVAAESGYSATRGPAAEASCATPPRVPRPPPDDLRDQIVASFRWRPGLNGSHQLLLRMPRDVYDLSSGVLREMRVLVSEEEDEGAATAAIPPGSSGDLSGLSQADTWHQFSSNETDTYQATTPGFIPEDDGSGYMEFIVGENSACTSDPSVDKQAYCNGPLRVNSSYSVQLVFSNKAGFTVSRPMAFQTKTVEDAEREMEELAAIYEEEQRRLHGRMGGGVWIGGEGTTTPSSGPTNTTVAPWDIWDTDWKTVGIALGSTVGIVSLLAAGFSLRCFHSEGDD